MKNKKLLISISVCLALVVVVVLFNVIFAVRTTRLVFHNEDGNPLATPSDGPSANDVMKYAGGANIFTLSESELLKQLNADSTFSQWHALDVVKSFPNVVEVHLVRRIAVCHMMVNGQTVYIDTFGYVMSEQAQTTTIDITDAFSGNFNGLVPQAGQRLQFSSASDNTRLQCILETVSAVWQLKYAYSDVPQLISAFSFDSTADSMTITTQHGAKIVVAQPTYHLSVRLIKAFSVYQNGGLDMQSPDTVIQVTVKGDIVTEKK